MGEARRRLTGTTALTAPAEANPISRAQLLAMAHEARARGGDPTVTGMTIIPADGSGPVYISAEQAKRRPGKARH